MTDLTKIVKRKTPATVFDKAKERNLIVSIEPAGRNSALIGIRIEGTRQTYRISANSVYNAAIALHLAKIEKRAKALQKSGVPARSAKAQARKEIDKDLR